MYSAKTIVHEGTTMVMLIVDDITEMEKQKEAIRAKNEEIMSGIRYAKKIQDALLPARQELLHALHDYFLLYRPRDVIGGDFYRTIRKDNKTILAVGDCTGHGIPGALLSMLGITGLNEIVKANGITRPDEVLFKLRTQIISELTNHDEEHLPHDGIDIAICTLDHDDRRLQFAGANSNIFFARNGKMSEIKGDRMPAGIYHQMNAFSLQEIAWEEGDMLYLFSDGYKDQFGGERDKKFGKKRFAELLAQVSLQNIMRQKEMLDKTLDDWKGHKDQVDDILVMGVRLD
jgi:serine phosphatase RsbU (regulator of sigma subunit)